jgi:hypothetical protein
VSTSDELEARSKVSERLAGMMTVLTAGLAVLATFEGGLGRVALNTPARLAAVVALVFLGILLAYLSAVLSPPSLVWRTLTVLSVLLTAGGLLLSLQVVTDATAAYDKPEVNAEFDGDVLRFSGSVSLLTSDEELIVTVFGYPPGWADLPPGPRGEDRGSELFRSSTGPTPSGRASVSGAVPVDAGRYEVVEVRAHRDVENLQCLKEGVEANEAGCVLVWTDPRPPLRVSP